jgi:type I restriction enzyme S subunit
MGAGVVSEARETNGRAGQRRFKPYPIYKDSGVEWLGKIPARWEVKRLKFAAILDPKASEAEDLAPDTEVSFVPMEAVSEYGGLDLAKAKPLADIGAGYTYFRDGDVVVAKITPCFENGKGAYATGLLNGIAFGTTELHVLRATQALNGQFLFYVTMSDAFRRLGEAEMYGAGGQKRVPGSFIENLRHPLPPVAEQRAIAAFLDRETARIDVLVAGKERLIDLLQEKRSALITQAVTRGIGSTVSFKDSRVAWIGQIPTHWEVKKVKRLCLVRRGASPRPIDDPIYFDDRGEYSWVRIADVTASERYLTTTTQSVSELGRSKSVSLEPGDLFVSIAATVGKPMITKIKCCIHDGFVYFVGLREDREYLYYVLSCGEPYRGLGKIGTQLNLNTDTIGDIYVPLPPRKEQQHIVEFLDIQIAKINAITARMYNAIDQLKGLRTALISAAVTGKIDVREEAA